MADLDYDPNDPNSLLKYLRLSNIFAPSSGNDQNSPDSAQDITPDITPNQSNSMIDMNDVIKRLMSPNEEMFNRMKSQVDEMPIESNFKNPGILTKLRAHLAAMGADNPVQARSIREGIEHEPYLQRLSEWKARLEPTEKLAQFENTRNVNDRLTGSTILRDEQTSRLRAETERKDRAIQDQRDREITIKENRARAYIDSKKFLQEHPKHKPFVDKNGKLWLYDDTDPNSKPIDTGLEKLSEMEKADIGVQGKLEEIQARSKSAKELESQKQTGRVDLEGVKEGNRETLETQKQTGRKDLETEKQTNRETTLKLKPSQYSSVRPQSETQRRVGLINKAQQIIAENPELKRYYTFEKNNAGNIIDVKVPPSVIFGDEEKRMKAYNLLYKQEPVPGFGSDKNVTPESKSSKPTLRSDGKTHVKRKSDGQIGWVTNPDMSKYDLEP